MPSVFQVIKYYNFNREIIFLYETSRKTERRSLALLATEQQIRSVTAYFTFVLKLFCPLNQQHLSLGALK